MGGAVLGESSQLPDGVRCAPLVSHLDERGCFTEVFRAEWPTGVSPVQWNVVRSAAGVLRGAHVHIRHLDYLVLLEGRASIVLRDLRRGSPTEGLVSVLELAGDRYDALTIPTGVAHAFWFRAPSLHIYAVSEYWDVADELGCHWADPDLGLHPFVDEPVVSARDNALPALSVLLRQIEGAQPFATAARAARPVAPGL